MNNSVTIQDLQDALMLSMREVKDLRFEITNLRDRLKTDARSIAYYIELEAKLDRMLNNTIDAHEVTKQRLLKYENEAGIPNKASKSETYLSQ
tara:strand:+ start:270 stop:548 length:279 start_codon:yes stop_codon:yes gene_type:complete